MKSVSIALLWFLSASVHAQTTDKFALVCEWKSATAGGSTTYYVDLVAKTVDGRKASISDNKIRFSKDTTEYSIDRTSGVLSIVEKNQKLYYPGPIHRCSKTSARKF